MFSTGLFPMQPARDGGLAQGQAGPLDNVMKWRRNGRDKGRGMQ
jgi:hypothetical protein